MKKIIQSIKKFYKENNKNSLLVFFTLRILIVVCMIRELINGNFENVLYCVLSLFLFILPYIIEKKLKIDFPSILEIIIFLFIFSAEILGEINNFYNILPYWDDILHTLNGFLCGSLGFSLVYLLNKKSNFIKLSPFFVALTAFCFSMTVGVTWEIFEYTTDNTFKIDMQKDEEIKNIYSVKLNPNISNKVVKIEDINYTTIYDKNGKEIISINNYLDIGLNDTMKDLIVNFIGALIFSIFGYLYIKNEKKYKLINALLTIRKT